jgi:hypothetical protein
MAGSPRRRTTRECWEDPQAFATTLVTLLVDTYGGEAVSWAPQTIVLELHDDFQVKLPPTNLDRLCAGMRLLSSDEFYVSAAEFNELCRVLAGEPLLPGMVIPADAAECAWGISEALLLSPPSEGVEEPFSAEVQVLLGKVLEDEGILTPPDVLKIALVDDNVARRVKYDLADDPEMFEAVWQVEKGKTDEIDRFVRDRLQALIIQLESLPLKNGDAAGWASRFLSAVTT